MSIKEENKRFPTYLKKKEPAWRRNCIASIKSFLEISSGCERMKDISEYTPIAQKYFSEDRDPAADIVKWKKTSGLASQTMKVYLSCIKEFLKSGGVILDEDDQKDLKKSFRGGIEVPEDAPDKNKIRSFLEHCDVRMRAITLMLSSTGMRMGELMSLTPESFDYQKRMIIIAADDSKNKEGRIVFFTREAELALIDWEKARSKYIKDHNENLATIKIDRTTKDDGRIFPYEPTSINRVWVQILKKAGMFKKDKTGIKNKIQAFHPHALRQYFSTQMRRNQCPDSYVEALLGHSQYLKTYIRYSKDEKLEMYDKYAGVLVIGLVDDVSATVNALAEKSTQLERENRELKERLSQVEKSSDVETMKSQMDEMKRQMEILSQLMTFKNKK